jgi:hypothetical protein
VSRTRRRRRRSPTSSTTRGSRSPSPATRSARPRSPVVLEEEKGRGRTSLLSAQVQAYGLAITISFLGLLLAGGALAAERDENAIGRLVRGLVGLGQLIVAKIALAVTVALGLGSRSSSASGSPSRRAGPGGEPWQRVAARAVGVLLAGARSARSGRSSARSRASRGRPRSSGCWSCCRSSSSASSRREIVPLRPGSATLPVRARRPLLRSAPVRRLAVGDARARGRWLSGFGALSLRSRESRRGVWLYYPSA